MGRPLTCVGADTGPQLRGAWRQVDDCDKSAPFNVSAYPRRSTWLLDMSMLGVWHKIQAASKACFWLMWTTAGLGLLLVVTPTHWLSVSLIQELGAWTCLATILGALSAIVYAVIGARRFPDFGLAAAALVTNAVSFALVVGKMLSTPGGTW
jgi:hypothetical protein